MNDEWTQVFAHPSHAVCSDRTLVLTSLDIPHQIVRGDGDFQVVVPPEFAERAKFELQEYLRENEPPRRTARPVDVTYQDALPGILAYIGTIGLFAWLAGEAAFGRDWLAAGRIDGRLLRDGELWRPFTALTLHLDLKHLLGNMGFGALFGFFAGRLAGPGVGWLTVVVAAALANGINTLLLDPAHRSIGASTAVFAALGQLAGFAWRAKLLSQERWPYRLGPIIGGVALLAYTGTGDANTDIGAHLAGFVCGFATGVLLTRVAQHFPSTKLQLACGVSAVAIVIVAWIQALLHWA